jgi:hypothetical protein
MDRWLDQVIQRMKGLPVWPVIDDVLRSPWSLLGDRCLGHRRRHRDMEGRVRRSPLASFWFWPWSAVIVGVAVLLVIGIFSQHRLVTPTAAFAIGLQVITGHHFTPGLWGEFVVLIATLIAIRGLVLQALTHRVNSPIEVRPLDDATRSGCLDKHRLDVVFRDYLALSRLYQITTVPGDQQPDRLIEVLNTPASSGRLALVAAGLAYAFPRRAFIVTATLLDENRTERCGVAIEVRPLGKLPVRLETQWSVTYERALQRAAFAVGAYITQETRACKRVPWSDWARRRRPLPASLFRDYQRAKQMVSERRYDEALALYNSALRQDPDNVAIRYDVGQLYERLGLYPDALLTYLRLVDEVFPAKTDRRTAKPSPIMREAQSRRARSEQLRRIRAWWPTWWPWPLGGRRDPFIIRYRYVVVLSEAKILARELISPRWPNLRNVQSQSYEERPWRATEIKEIGRLLSERLDSVYFPAVSAQKLEFLMDQVRYAPEYFRQRDYPEIVRYFLRCAAYEADTLIRDLEILECSWRGRVTTRDSFLTPTAVRQLRLMICYRLEHTDRAAVPQHVELHEARRRVEELTRCLESNKYVASRSGNWLEHYLAACVYSLAIVDDDKEKPFNIAYAQEAVSALERAARLGDEVEFVTSKRYWLQAGDPDLAGLRNYQSFRAFEARIYDHPLPFTAELSKYELYRHLRAVIRQAAQQLEERWRDRAKNRREFVDDGEFEVWWRQELRAWEVAIRIGRFYPQWQTRYAAQEAIREWYEASLGPDAPPIPYPNITRSDYRPDTGDPGLVRDMLAETEEIFAFLGADCGNLVRASSEVTIYDKVRRWSEYAAACSRKGRDLSAEALADACLAQAAVWAALRQWAQVPGGHRKQALERCIADVIPPDENFDPGHKHVLARDPNWLRREAAERNWS